MDFRLFFTVFATVFVAELGDKTQLSTVLYASGSQHSKWVVFLGSALALVVSSALGVFVGGFIGSRISPTVIGRVAGVGFILVGAWTLWKS